MCDRRFCGCVLRQSNLIKAAGATVAVVALAGGAAPLFQDLLNAILITLSVLIAGMVAIFVLQIRGSRRRAIRPGPAPAAAGRRRLLAARSAPQHGARSPLREAIRLPRLPRRRASASPLPLAIVLRAPLASAPPQAQAVDGLRPLPVAALIGERDAAP